MALGGVHMTLPPKEPQLPPRISTARPTGERPRSPLLPMTGKGEAAEARSGPEFILLGSPLGLRFWLEVARMPLMPAGARNGYLESADSWGGGGEGGRGSSPVHSEGAAAAPPFSTPPPTHRSVAAASLRCGGAFMASRARGRERCVAARRVAMGGSLSSQEIPFALQNRPRTPPLYLLPAFIALLTPALQLGGRQAGGGRCPLACPFPPPPGPGGGKGESGPHKQERTASRDHPLFRREASSAFPTPQARQPKGQTGAPHKARLPLLDSDCGPPSQGQNCPLGPPPAELFSYRLCPPPD